MKGKLWTKVSSDARDLVKMMLTIDSKKRISAQKALDHPWFGLIRDIKIDSAVEKEERLDTKTLNRLKVSHGC
jgi:serine/threonine protein kinase